MIISRTPYRISFFGGGTDYPEWVAQEGGAVLSTTIDKYCYITCRYLPPFFADKHRIVWSNIELVSNLQDIIHPAIREALKYYLGNEVDGIEIHHQGDLPARSGIGSSSSFAVGLIKALHALQGRIITKKDNAIEAIKLEQDLLKENVGSQDQIASAFGGFNKIELKSNRDFNVEPVITPAKRLSDLNDRLLLYFTGTTRISSQIAGDIVANLQAKKTQLRRIRQMVDQGLEILSSACDLDEFGHLMDEAWKYKRSLSDLVSNSEIDQIYQMAKTHGALGGKLLGAGSSGFMLFYVPEEFQEKFKTAMASLLHIPFRFETSGSTILHHSQ